MKEIFEFVCVFACGFIFGSYMGNHEGDRLTLRDCATKGEATMAGGGTITCEVKKEQR